jgi:hypothetical protein
VINRKMTEFVEPLLGAGETVQVAMHGFRPLSRSMAFLAAFPAVFGGFAIGSAAGWPAWVGGGIGGGVGAGLAMALDQRRARAEHDGRGLAVGLVATERRFMVLEMRTGLVAAEPVGVELEQPLDSIASVGTEKMQGSGLKRAGLVMTFDDGAEVRLIPARVNPMLEALGHVGS